MVWGWGGGAFGAVRENRSVFLKISYQTGAVQARKEVCLGCGQKMAQLPPHHLLGLCQHSQKEAACYTQQLPLETTKWTPGRSSVPTSSILVSNLMGSLISETFMCQMLPNRPPLQGGHPGLSQRDTESNAKPLGGQVGLARQRSEWAG